MKINSAKHAITVDELKQHVRYDPITGDMYRTTKIVPRSGEVISMVRLVIGCNNRGYRWLKIFGHMYLVHRLAVLYMTGSHPVGEIDHIDGDRKNNTWSNLRDCDTFANSRNQGIRKDCTSGVRGVTFSKIHGKWVARISHRGTRYSLGYFLKKSDAVERRRTAEVEFGYHPNHGDRQSWRG